MLSYAGYIERDTGRVSRSRIIWANVIIGPAIGGIALSPMGLSLVNKWRRRAPRLTDGWLVRQPRIPGAISPATSAATGNRCRTAVISSYGRTALIAVADPAEAE